MNERYADLRASLELRLGQLDLNLCEDRHGSYGTIDVTREQVNFITAAHPEAIRSLLADYDRLREALSDAQRSLDTIATLGGSKADFMGTMRQVREYANSRARMARCALTQEGKGVNQSLTTERDGAAKGADHIDAQRAELETLRGVLAGVPQDAIDGGWTAAGISAYAKNLEAENRVLRKALTGAQEPLCWMPEDELPKSLTSDAYDALFPYSRVDFVRWFPIYAPSATPIAREPVMSLTITRALGTYGAAFDPPGPRRAYTYVHQPGNIGAYRLGSACGNANSATAGDNIDRGLGLLKELQAHGFGVFEIEASSPTAPVAAQAQPGTQDREDADIDAREAARLAKTLAEFGDDGETTTDYCTLLRWADLGLLECTHFVETDKGRAAAARAAKEQS